MTGWTSAGPSMLASFLASLVEFVEALTIVLAVGIARGWRSALLGAGAGVALLAVLVMTLGASLSAVPLPILQLVIGVLLLMFGLRWLRKAVLRQAGVLPLHDESEAFAKESERMRLERQLTPSPLDKIAFITSFKAVLLEGLEVVFIVIALGAGGRSLMPAVSGAAVALALVLVLGFLLHRPLSRVPENALKFGVGVVLAAFGTFWAGEGIGIHWPGEDVAIGYLVAAFLANALAQVAAARRLHSKTPKRVSSPAVMPAQPAGPLGATAAELWGLFVDDGWLASGILLWTVGAWSLDANLSLSAPGAPAFFASGLVLLLWCSVVQRARQTR